MADVVNLRRARKDKARKDADAAAAENRAKFGRTKAEKERDTRVKGLAARHLDQTKLDD